MSPGHPFVLSLSKDRTSFLHLVEKGQPFDKLRVNGFVDAAIAPISDVMTEYITVGPEDRAEARSNTIKLHGPDGFAGMRAAGRLAAGILDKLTKFVAPGVTTQEIDDIVYRMTVDGGGVPATLGYRGYTKSCCTSINHVVCHGIPSDKALKDGDIVNIDVTPILGGWHGDTSRMYLVGDVPLKARKLVEVTYECLMLGLELWTSAGTPRVDHLGAVVEQAAKPVPAEIADDAVAMLFGVGLDGVADIAQTVARLGLLKPEHQAFVGHFDQFARFERDIAY